MIQKVIDQEKEKIIADICRKIADREWVNKLISETPDSIKELKSSELRKQLKDESDEDKIAELKEQIEMCQRHEQDLVDLNNCLRSLESDVNSFKVLENGLEEITNLLK